MAGVEEPTAATAPGAVRWVALLLVSAAYLATTTGEALVSPVYPLAADDLGLDLAAAGLAFATLAIAIALSTLAGGFLLRVLATGSVLSLALLVTAGGCVLAASARSATPFLAAQLLLGTGAGLLYPAAVMTVGSLAGPDRRGLAMGVFGVFFSGGLALAAGLAALGGEADWRLAFWIGAALAAAAGGVVFLFLHPPRASATGPLFAGLTAVLGVPSAVGVVGGISQYATVSFLPAYAVVVWGRSEAWAALLLLTGRVLSVPAKLASGVAADRFGPIRTAQAIGAVLAMAAVAWTASSSLVVGAVGAVVFAAEVSALFPLANLLAVERAGTQGPTLGVFRSLQLGAGAVGGLAIGAAAQRFGLRPTLAVVAVVPLALAALSLLEPRAAPTISDR